VARRYLRALKRAHVEGSVRGYREREIEVLVYMLMGARSYINVRFLTACSLVARSVSVVLLRLDRDDYCEEKALRTNFM